MKNNSNRAPDEKGSIYVRGHIKISDVTDKTKPIILCNKSNAIHFENISSALAYGLANKGQNYIYEMRFGNGGSSVDPTGVITYLPPNTNTQNSNLYNPTYSKIVDDTAIANSDPTRNYIEVRHVPGELYTDILVSCLLDYGEPAGQAAFDNSQTLDQAYVFDELGLVGRDSTTGATDSLVNNVFTSDAGPLLTHVIFHPVQKSLNRLIQIDYTVRIQTLTMLTA